MAVTPWGIFPLAPNVNAMPLAQALDTAVRS
jgi:hypothetical protein